MSTPTLLDPPVVRARASTPGSRSSRRSVAVRAADVGFPSPPHARDGARRRLVPLRLIALAGTLASAVLVADIVRPGRSFCPLEEACSQAKSSALGSVLGIPTAALGTAAFVGLLLLTVLPLRAARIGLRAAGLLAALAGVTFLAYQALVLKRFCPLCVVADVAGLAAGLAVLAWAAPTANGSGPLEALGSRIAWVLTGILAVALPLAWPRSASPSRIPVPEIAADSGILAPLREAPLDPVTDSGLSGVPDLPPAEAQPMPGFPPPEPPAATEEPRARAEPTPSAAGVAAFPPPAAVAPPPAVIDPPRPPGVRPPPPAVVVTPPPVVVAPPPPAMVVPPKRTIPAAEPARPALPSRPDATRTPTAPSRATAAVAAAPVPPPAPVVQVPIVEFLNAFCPHCRATHARLDGVLRTMATPVRRYRVYVWSSEAPPLWAQACACAAAAGKEDALFAELLREERDTPDAVWAAARRVGLDPGALSASVRRGEATTRLQGERQRVSASSIRRLPTLDIGRWRLEGEQSEAELLSAIRVAIDASSSGRIAGEPPAAR